MSLLKKGREIKNTWARIFDNGSAIKNPKTVLPCEPINR